MSDVYSERFVASYNYAGWKYWTVPAGKRAVVRAVSAFNDIMEATPIFGVQLGGAWVYYWTPPGAGTTVHSDVRWTVYEGEQLATYTSVSRIGYALNGFLFAAGGGPPAGELTMGPGIDVDVPLHQWREGR